MKTPICCKKFMELKTSTEQIRYKGPIKLIFQCNKCGMVRTVTKIHKGG